MDFGKILESWEKQENPDRKKNNERNEMDHLLDRYHPGEGDSRDDSVTNEPEHPSERRKRLLAMKPQASLDLHGSTAEEAVRLIRGFIEKSVSEGLRKVMIIHGKGHHSADGPVLSRVVADEVGNHPLAGENGLAAGREGGRGARWVVLRSVEA